MGKLYNYFVKLLGRIMGNVRIERATEELLNSRYLLDIQLFDIEKRSQIIKLLLENQRQGSIINCILINNETIGYCTFFHEDNTLILFINPEYQKMGYGTILGKRTIEDVFNQNKNNIIKIKTLIDRPSNKLATKAGFRETFRDEKEIIYELSKEDFLKNDKS